MRPLQPAAAPRTLALYAELADAIWHAAGDTATDLSWCARCAAHLHAWQHAWELPGSQAPRHAALQPCLPACLGHHALGVPPTALDPAASLAPPSVLSRYTKRALLAGVYSATELYMLNDCSPGAAGHTTACGGALQPQWGSCCMRCMRTPALAAALLHAPRLCVQWLLGRGAPIAVLPSNACLIMWLPATPPAQGMPTRGRRWTGGWGRPLSLERPPRMPHPWAMPWAVPPALSWHS